MTTERRRKPPAREISQVDIADPTSPEEVLVMFDHEKYLRHVAGLALAVFAAALPLAVYDTATTPAAAQAENIAGQVTTVAPTKRSATPPTSVPIPFARPQITGPAPLPAEERGLPGD
jgi:hypothetical protein